MKKMLVVGIVAVAGLLAGCASVGEKVLIAGTTGSNRFNVEDVDAAIVIAQNAKDTVAENCFKALKNHLGADVPTEIKGVVSAYAAARTRVRESRRGLAEDVHINCSPLVVDSGTFFSRFGATVGAIVP